MSERNGSWKLVNGVWGVLHIAKRKVMYHGLLYHICGCTVEHPGRTRSSPSPLEDKDLEVQTLTAGAERRSSQQK